MTAAIISLGVGALSLLTTLGVGGVSVFQGYEMAFQGAQNKQFILVSTCGFSVLSALVTFCSLFGGFVAMRTLMNAEVKATFT